MKVAIVWFRNDLRLADNPALNAACQNADAIVPVFVHDNGILKGKHASPNRQRYLRQSLADLQAALQQKGSNLTMLAGRPENVLPNLVQAVGASIVYAATDYSGYAARRDAKVAVALSSIGTQLDLMPGRLVVDNPLSLCSGSGRPYQVFTPFYRAWLRLPRREVLSPPNHIRLPSGYRPPEVNFGDAAVPPVAQLALPSVPILQGGGRTLALQRLKSYWANGLSNYHEDHDNLAIDTSRLSAYLHFGCLSALEVEAQLPDGPGPEAWRRQLAWRDFYHYILAHHPTNAQQAFQSRYRDMVWDNNPQYLHAWQTGHTGYPLVDAAMRQLLTEGFMHNRARLVVGSFLTKDLGIDWREGESHFMRHLIDGDQANNNGNWQWIASVGVDPAPVFRRMYNPTTQALRYDASGIYIRRFVPELAGVPLEFLAEPWKMTDSQQIAANCRIGQDYPVPIIDHAVARAAALARYSSWR